MRLLLATMVAASLGASCSDSSTPPGGPVPSGGAPDGASPAVPTQEAGVADGAAPLPSDANRPPTSGSADMDRWLAQGHHKSWKCEAAPHAARAGSAHSANRICSNPLLSGHPDGAGAFPVDSAAVKELYDSAGKLNGHAVYRRVGAGNDGAAWYWYERVGSSVVADGLGGSGPAKSICASCHEGAGNAGQPGRDFVFTQVR